MVEFFNVDVLGDVPTLNSPYTEEELRIIESSGIKIYGELEKHPILRYGGKSYRPILFLSDIEKLNVEATDNRCNLKCDFCYFSKQYPNSRMNEDYMRMPMYINRELIDALPNLKKFVPYSINEPGMRPKMMVELLKYVWEKRRAEVFISSNLSLPWKNYCDWIGLEGIEKVTIGAGGISKETHEKDRINSKWEVFIQNIKNLVELRKKTGFPKIITYQVVLTKSNEHEYENLENFCRELGVQQLQYKSLALKTPASENMAPNDGSLKVPTDLWMDKQCGYMFEGATVVLSNHNGKSKPGPKVAMCVCGYFDPPEDQEYIRGDLLEQDFFTALNDLGLQKLRMIQLEKGMKEIPACVKCDCRKPLSEDYIYGGTLQNKDFHENM